MRAPGEIIRHEIRELVPPLIYFLITFNIIGVTEFLLLRDFGIPVSAFVRSTIYAMLAAKGILIVDVLPFVRPFPSIPIIYNAIWKTLLCLIALVLLQLLEDAIPLLFKQRPLGPLFDQLARPHFWVIQTWMGLVVLVFCTFQELRLAIGAERTREVFLGR